MATTSPGPLSIHFGFIQWKRHGAFIWIFLYVLIDDSGWFYFYSSSYQSLVDTYPRGLGFISWCCGCLTGRTRVLAYVSFWLPDDVYRHSNARIRPIKTDQMALSSVIYYCPTLCLFRKRLEPIE